MHETMSVNIHTYPFFAAKSKDHCVISGFRDWKFLNRIDQPQVQLPTRIGIPHLGLPTRRYCYESHE